MNKKITYWLLGKTAGRTSIAAWNWLWGLPVESGGKIARNVASESIVSMQESISKLTKAVAKIVAAHDLARQQYQAKIDELQQAEKQAQVASSNGNQEAARLAIAKAIATEKILPQMSDRLTHATDMMHKAQSKLKREVEKLEAYKLEMSNLEALSKLNGVMAEISQINDDFDISSAKNQFAEAKDSIEQKAFLETAKSQLCENPAEELEAEIDLMSLEAEIDHRLKELNA